MHSSSADLYRGMYEVRWWQLIKNGVSEELRIALFSKTVMLVRHDITIGGPLKDNDVL